MVLYRSQTVHYGPIFLFFQLYLTYRVPFLLGRRKVHQIEKLSPYCTYSITVHCPERCCLYYCLRFFFSERSSLPLFVLNLILYTNWKKKEKRRNPVCHARIISQSRRSTLFTVLPLLHKNLRYWHSYSFFFLDSFPPITRLMSR